jgi:tetratricopeptide (TPR) repeat protein
MNYRIKFILFIVFALSGRLIEAQNSTDEKLAVQYYNNQEYDKAVIYYEKIFNKSHSDNHYHRLLNCFVYLEEYKNAEKLIKKQTKRFPSQLDFYVDLGDLYEKINQQTKATAAYEKALKLLSPNHSQIMRLANGFLKHKKAEYTIQTYLKGRKLLKGTYPFNFELAQVYNLQGEVEKMLSEYLGLLAVQESYLQSVQNALQTALNPDENGEKKALLKSLLIRTIQKHPDKKVYSEMLIWLYIQEKNFNGAFIQAKALDKRNKEYGKRIIGLAKLALTNKEYDVAIKCYQYVIDKGDENYFYISSKMELVNVYNEKIISANAYTNDDLLQLEKTYQTTIAELGKTASTVSLLSGLAHLQAFYLHQTDAAINLLNEIISMSRIKPQDAAKNKIELADIYLFTGNIWDASLLYSQVEKAYKYDRLGETAKFKNAKISFYTGDFGWAKAQLDVLKASTSKLIANDAMQLSMLITDNIGIDTTKAPLMLFAQADLLAYQNKNEEAMNLLDSLIKGYPFHTIADDILYKRYQINYKQKKFEAAAENLEGIVDKYATDILGDDAVYNLALLYDNQLNDREKATKYYKKVMFDYQNSVYVVDARKRYRELEQGVKIIEIEDDVLKFEAN